MTKKAKTTALTDNATLTPENRLEVLDLADLSKRLEKSTIQIRKEIGNITKSFCRIGYELYNVRERKLYLGQGLNSVLEYGEKIFGFKKSSISNYISICERFSVRKEDRPTYQLLPDFANFSYGQLSLMLSMLDDKLSEISPDSTCKDIREMKKADVPKDSDNSDNGDAPASDSGSSSAQSLSEMLFKKVLGSEDFELIAKILHDYIGREITVTVG